MMRKAATALTALALAAPAAPAQDRLPPEILAKMCDDRAGCKLGWLRQAGADQYGRALAVAEIDLGERRGPRDHIVCVPYRREYWLVISGPGNPAPRKLFEACPQPQIGTPEPELRIGANFMEYAIASAGGDLRTRHTLTLQLAPLKRTTETACGGYVSKGSFELLRWDWQRLIGENIAAESGVAEADLCRAEKGKLTGRPIPFVQVAENLADDAAPHLGSCAASFDETGALGFVRRGDAAAPGAGAAWRVAVLDGGRHVDILVTVAGAIGPEDRIELRLHHRNDNKSIRAFAFRVADGAADGTAAPERPRLVARSHDAAGPRTSLRWRLADGTTPNRLAVTLIRRDGDKEIRAVSTAPWRGDDPETLGDTFSIGRTEGRCAAADGALDIVEMGLLPE